MVLGPLMPLATHGRWSESGNQLDEKRKLPGPCCSEDLNCSGLTISSGLRLLSLHNSKEFSRYQTHMTSSYFWWTIWVFRICLKYPRTFCLFSGAAGDVTQGLGHTRQVLCHWAPALALLELFHP